jgi:hypothetical protein
VGKEDAIVAHGQDEMHRIICAGQAHVHRPLDIVPGLLE